VAAAVVLAGQRFGLLQAAGAALVLAAIVGHELAPLNSRLLNMSPSRHSGYVPQDIEPKWQKVWADRGVMKASDDSPKPKFYDLVMYPYPSGDLTVGHARNYVMGDVLARMKRMQGFEVLSPVRLGRVWVALPRMPR